MLSLFVPFVYFCLATLGLVLLTKKSFGRTLPLTFFGSSLMLFISQLIFQTFSVGFYFCIAFAGLSLGFAIFQFCRSKSNLAALLRQNYLTAGFFAFTLIYLMVFIYDFHRGFTVWDEFSHWGMMLKEMLRLDRFYYVNESNLLVHKDYPPILQLFELFWLKLTGGFSETVALRAVHTFELALFIPFITETVSPKHKWQGLIFSALLSVLFVLTTLSFDLHGVIHTIYNDYTMALITVYVFIAIFFSKKIGAFEILEVSLCGAFLLLLKQMGLPLYLMILVFFAGILLVRNNFRIRQFIHAIGWRKLLLASATLLAPFVLWFIWGELTSDVAHQFDYSDLAISDLPGIFLGSKGEPWQRLAIKNYLLALGTENISTTVVPLTFFGAILISLGLLYFIFQRFRANLDKNETILLGAILFIGAAGYAVTMLILYTFSFGEYEGTILASYERYMGTYSLIMISIPLAMLCYWAAKNKQIKPVIITTACLALSVSPSAYLRLYPNPTGTAHSDVANVANFVKENVPADARVFVAYDSPVGFFYYFQYFATPLSVNNVAYDWTAEKGSDARAFYTTEILPELKQYDYLLIHNYNDEFLNNYCEVVCPSTPDTLYKIEKTNGEITGFAEIAHRFATES